MHLLEFAAAALAAFILLVLIVGILLPREHRATRSATFNRPPTVVWQAITDVKAYPHWRADLRRVEVLPARDGKMSWREFSRRGAMTFEAVTTDEPRTFVTRIVDEDLPFAGSWTFTLDPAANGTILTIREDGIVKNPIFRFVGRFALGYSATIDAYHTALARRLGEAGT
jgi:Polyketide cyclase / dehydrase and lipid transport